MESSILSEVDDTSILRTGSPRRYSRPLNWLPASRLLPRVAGWSAATLCFGASSPFARAPAKDRSPPRADVQPCAIGSRINSTGSAEGPSPRRKPGLIARQHEPRGITSALPLLENFGVAVRWIPVCPGRRGENFVIASSIPISSRARKREPGAQGRDASPGPPLPRG